MQAIEKRLTGNKPELLYRAFLYSKQLQVKGKDLIASLDSNPGCKSFTNFLKATNGECVDWKAPPSDLEILAHLKGAGDNIGVASAEEDATPHFTHSEFARLILIMRDEERARRAVYQLSQPLERSALDGGITRETYWSVIIADRFNNFSPHVRFDFGGNIVDIDASKAPLCTRTGTVLKDQFQRGKPEFTRAITNWKKSGQNDPTRFQDFLRYNNGRMCSSSKRAFIIFVCCQLGTTHELPLLLEIVLKTIVDGGCEGGIQIGQNGDQADDTAAKRRKKGSGVITEGFEDMKKIMVDLGSAVNSLIQAKVTSITSGRFDESKTEKNAEEEKDECFERLEDTFQCLQRARKYGEHKPLQYAQMRYDDAMEKFERVKAKNSSPRWG